MIKKNDLLQKIAKLGRKITRSKEAPERSGNNQPIESKEAFIKAEVESQTLLQALDKSALVSITDADGFIIYVNDKFVEVSQYPRKMLIGQNHRMLKSNLQPQSLFEDLWNTISNGRIWRGEIKNRAKDGSLYWVDSTICPILGDNGKPLKYIAIRFVVTDRKTIDKKAQEASRYARSLLETSLDPLVTISAEGKITDVNEATVKVTGISRQELIGSDFLSYFTEPDKAREGYQQVFAKGFVADYPLTIRHISGKHTDVLYNASVYKDAHGIVLGVFAAARDVTAQKQAEELVAEQRALEVLRSEQSKTLEKFRRMATVIQDSNDAITIQDLEGRILAWNRGAEKVYGYSEAEALNMNIVDTVPKEYQTEALGFLISLKRGELLPNLETKRKHKDGRILDVWLTNTKLTDDKGILTGIATTERDITERKQSEAALMEKFRELDYLREGQIALSETMRGEQIISRLGQSILSHLVPFTNAQVGAFYVVTEDKKLQIVSGHALPKAEASEKFVEFGEGLIGQVAIEKKSLLINDIPSSYFNKIESALGALVPRSLLISPIFYEHEVVGVVELGSLHQFTEHQRSFLASVSENIGIAINTSSVRKKVEKQNEALNKAQILLKEGASEIQRASRYKTEFLANMSHEIRTPVGAILGFIDLMKNRANTIDENQNYIAIADRNSQHLLRLIDDILDLSKVEVGMMTVESIQFSLAEMLADFNSLMRFKAEEKGVKLLFTTDTLIPELICSDPVRLRQILTNMVGNAIKFTDKGTIDFRVAFENPILKFTVKDTGIGISKDQASKLFQPFTQADTSTTRRFGGTGLGLVLSKRLCESLGGSLELIESNPDSGSTFVIEIKSILLPNTKFVGKEALTFVAAKKTDFKEKRQALRGLKVLLVDDSSDNIFLISTYLHKEGAQVKTASDGASGVELALSESFDVLLMDIQMPILGGHEAAQKLRQLKYTKPIIALTAHAMNEEREKCFESGFTEFLTKPIQFNQFIKVLVRYIPGNFSG